MPPIVSQLIAQPWALPVLVGIGSLMLGLLIPRRGGSSWLAGIFFFVPHLFLDLLDMVHTKKFKYYGLVTALLSIEAFFAFRASTVYYDILNTRMPPLEMALVCIIVFVAVFLCGYMVATHGKITVASGCTMAFVIIHDWAGTVWMNYSTVATSTTSATIATPDDPLKLVLTIGMCVLGLLPFIMGAWAEELRPQLEEELDEEVDTFTSTATRKIKRRAVERVLRLANRTDVVRLVQALPAAEFLDFKRFVMPIIAEPGTPYNLVHSEPAQDGIQTTSETSEPDQLEVQPENHQIDEQEASEVNGPLVASEQSNESDFEQHKAVKKTARKQSKNTSKPINRDAKIRQFAAAHPEFTHAQLAARYHLSASTISRVLSVQQAQPQESNPTGAEPAHNGHNTEQELDTGALENVSVSESDLLALAHQN